MVKKLDTTNYKEVIGNPTEKKGDKTFPESLLDRATHYRDFEIKASWERSKYFILFLGALFIAYYTMKQPSLADSMRLMFYMVHPISTVPHWMFVLITGLGTIISFIWYWVNRGSKLIYENWEHHIDFIEEEYQLGNISRVHCWKPFYWYKLLDTYPISPSKSNTLVSLLISVSFLILFVYETGILDCVVWLCCKTDCVKCILFFTFFYILFCLPVWIKSKSYPTDDCESSNKNINVRNRISKKRYCASYKNEDTSTWTEE